MSSMISHKSLFISLALMIALMMGTGLYLGTGVFALDGAAEGIEMDGNIIVLDVAVTPAYDWDDLFTDGTIGAKPVLEGGIPAAFVGTVFERDFVPGKKVPTYRPSLPAAKTF